MYSDIIPGINDGFFPRKLKPQTTSIAGPEHFCEDIPMQDYKVDVLDAMYWDWQVTGGMLVNTTAYDSIATIQWAPLAASHALAVTPYSMWEGRGDTTTFISQIHTGTTQAYHLTTSYEWTNDASWDQGYVPLPCDHVVIPDQASPVIVNVLPMLDIQIRSLTTGENVGLEIGTKTVLKLIDY